MKASKVVLGVLGGVAVGAILGVLFAPEEGKKTRKKILSKGNSLLGKGTEYLSKGGEYVEDIKNQFDDLYDDASKKYSDIVNTAKEAVSDLERK